MASAISSSLIISPQNLFSSKPHLTIHSKQPSLLTFKQNSSFSHLKLSNNGCCSTARLFAAVAEVATVDTSSEVSRRLYVGNIPRTVDSAQLTKMFEEHGAVEKAEVMYDKFSGRSRRFAFVTMKTVEDANAAIEKLNGTEISGRQIKVNITEKPLQSVDLSFLQGEDFIDSPHKVYVGNLAKTVTSETLKSFFSEKARVLSAKVSRAPGTSKSSGFGFVSFSSEDEVEAAISASNNSLLEGQKIRVNKA